MQKHKTVENIKHMLQTVYHTHWHKVIPVVGSVVSSQHCCSSQNGSLQTQTRLTIYTNFTLDEVLPVGSGFRQVLIYFTVCLICLSIYCTVTQGGFLFGVFSSSTSKFFFLSFCNNTFRSSSFEKMGWNTKVCCQGPVKPHE